MHNTHLRVDMTPLRHEKTTVYILTIEWDIFVPFVFLKAYLKILHLKCLHIKHRSTKTTAILIVVNAPQRNKNA